MFGLGNAELADFKTPTLAMLLLALFNISSGLWATPA